MRTELDDLTSDLWRFLGNAMRRARDYDLENNYDGDLDDYDGLDDDALDALIENAADDLASGYCPTTDDLDEKQALEAMLDFLKNERKERDDAWEVRTITLALKKLSGE